MRLAGPCLIALLVAAPAAVAQPAPAKPEGGALGMRPAAKPRKIPIHFVAGETMVWKLKVRGLTAGTVQMAAGEPGTVGGRRTEMLVAGANPEGLFRLVSDASGVTTVTVDVDRGAPVKHRLETKGGWVESTLGGPSFDVVVKRANQDPEAVRQQMPPGELASDTPAALLAARAVRLGKEVALSALADERIWRATLKGAKRETITTPLGKFPALRVEGNTRRLDRAHEVDPGRAAQPFTMWISEDEHRLPLRVSSKMPYGEVTLELVQYEGGDLALAAD